MDKKLKNSLRILQNPILSSTIITLISVFLINLIPFDLQFHIMVTNKFDKGLVIPFNISNILNLLAQMNLVH